MRNVEANFFAWLEEKGRRVPGSERFGHNVFTTFGEQWLAQLVAWSLIGDPADDEPFTDFRVRWLGVGSGSQLELKGVVRLVTPLTITTGPDVYIQAVSPPTFTTNFSQRYVTTFTGASSAFDHHGASVSVSEAGLFVDRDPGAGAPTLSVASADNVPVAYKAFPALTKLAAQDLVITWELRF